jgi:hypothetical protein
MLGRPVTSKQGLGAPGVGNAIQIRNGLGAQWTIVVG